MSPDRPPLRRPHLVQHALGRLRWPISRRLGFHAWGDERSQVRGPAVEYADVREYEYGEDARLIDWNLTARSDRPFVRDSHPDRGVDAWLLLDASASLDWGTALQLKRETGIEMAAAAVALLGRHGSRVGAIVFDFRVRCVLPPAAGRTGRLRLLSRLQIEASGPPAGSATGLAAALRQAALTISRPSLVIVISDFISAGDWQRPMAILGRRHEVVAVRVFDPTELSIPDIGVVTFEDPETGAQLQVDTSDRRLRERFRLAAADQSRLLSRQLIRARATELKITTGAEFMPQLTAYLRRRSKEGERGGRQVPPA